MQTRVKIDEIDSIILKTLLNESRTSFTDIAKECKISLVAVRMRYKRLWKTGMINGEIMQVNPYSLGYKSIVDIGIVTATEDEEDVLGFLENKPYILHFIKDFGKYSFGVQVALIDMQELAAILDDLASNHLIKQVESMIWAEAINIDHPENLIIKPFADKKNAIGRVYEVNHQETQLDETDRKIAKILSQNSRRSFKKIAEEIGISTKNVIQRYRRLRGTVLTSSAIQVDLNKLGYGALAQVFVKIANRSKIPEINEQLLQIPNLLILIRLIGSFDVLVLVALEDFGELFKLKESIHRIPGIEETDVFVRPNFSSWPLNVFSTLLQ